MAARDVLALLRSAERGSTSNEAVLAEMVKSLSNPGSSGQPPQMVSSFSRVTGVEEKSRLRRKPRQMPPKQLQRQPLSQTVPAVLEPGPTVGVSGKNGISKRSTGPHRSQSHSITMQERVQEALEASSVSAEGSTTTVATNTATAASGDQNREKGTQQSQPAAARDKRGGLSRTVVDQDPIAATTATTTTTAAAAVAAAAAADDDDDDDDDDEGTGSDHTLDRTNAYINLRKVHAQRRQQKQADRSRAQAAKRSGDASAKLRSRSHQILPPSFSSSLLPSTAVAETAAAVAEADVTVEEGETAAALNSKRPRAPSPVSNQALAPATSSPLFSDIIIGPISRTKQAHATRIAHKSITPSQLVIRAPHPGSFGGQHSADSGVDAEDVALGANDAASVFGTPSLVVPTANIVHGRGGGGRSGGGAAAEDAERADAAALVHNVPPSEQNAAVLADVSSRTHRVHKTREETSSEARELKSEIGQSLVSTAEMLPPVYLIKHGLYEYAHDRGMGAVAQLLDKMRLHLLRQGTEHWKLQNTMVRKQQELVAALMLQRIGRGAIARLRARAQRAHQEASLSAGEREAERRRKFYANSIVKAQGFARVVIAKRVAAGLRVRLAAAVRVQIKWRSYARVLAAKRELLRRRRLRILAIHSQRIVRGFLARCHFKVIKVRVYQKHNEARYSSMMAILDNYFTQYGAAITIQRWWKTAIPWRNKLHHESILKKQALMISGRAGRIQRAWWCYRARLLAQALREERDALQRAKEAAALEFQRLVRGHLGRCKAHRALVRECFRQHDEFRIRVCKDIELHGEKRKVLPAPLAEAIKVRRDADDHRYDAQVLYKVEALESRRREKVRRWKEEARRLGRRPSLARQLSGMASRRMANVVLAVKPVKSLTAEGRFEDAVVALQRRFRARRHRILALQRMKYKHYRAACRIQTWWALYRWLLHRKKAVRVIQKTFRRQRANIARRTEAARVIQIKFRAYKSALDFTVQRLKRVKCAEKIQATMRRALAVRRLGRTKFYQRLRHEERLIAGTHYATTRQRAHLLVLARGATTDNYKLPYELQRLFLHYCQIGARGAVTMDVSKLARFCRECPKLVDEKHLKANDIDLAFAEARDKGEAKLRFENFLRVIEVLAIRRLRHQWPQLLAEEKGRLRKKGGGGKTESSRTLGAGAGAGAGAVGGVGAVASSGGSRKHLLRRSSSTASMSKLEERNAAGEGGSDGTGGVTPSLGPGRPTLSRRQSTGSLQGLVGSLSLGDDNGSSPSGPSAAAVPQGPFSETITFPPFRGTFGLMIEAIHRFIVPNPAFQRISETLRNENGTSMEIRGDEYLHKCATVVQAAYRTFWARRLFEVFKAKHLAEQRRKFLDRNATVIQTCVRGFLGRWRMARRGQQTYVKFLDGDTREIYYFNPRNGVSHWSKPALLRTKDCGYPVLVPEADRRYVVLCSVCEDETSTRYCHDCDAAFCGRCAKDVHHTAARRDHDLVQQDNCIQCDFQAATRRCTGCSDHFCDTCYGWLHSKGRLQVHDFRWATSPCDVCSEWAAQYRTTLQVAATEHFEAEEEAIRNGTLRRDRYKTPEEVELDKNPPRRHYCVTCAKQTFGVTSREELDNDVESIERVPYLGPTITAYRKRRKAAELQRAKLEEYQEKQREMKRLYRRKCAVDIQRMYRGYRTRVEIQPYLAMRRERLALRAADDGTRRNPLYMLGDLFGIAPELPSDTPKELILKRFPRWLRGVVCEIVGTAWGPTFDLVDEEQKVRERMQQVTHRQVADMILSYTSKAMHLLDTKRRTRGIGKRHERLRADYRRARDGGVPRAQRQAMQKLAADARKEFEKATAAMQKEQAKLKQLGNKISTVLRGPRLVQHRMHDAMKNGKLLPFKVQMIQRKAVAVAPDATWKKLLKEGDRVCIGTVVYRIVDAEVHEAEGFTSLFKNNFGDDDEEDDYESEEDEEGEDKADDDDDEEEKYGDDVEDAEHQGFRGDENDSIGEMSTELQAMLNEQDAERRQKALLQKQASQLALEKAMSHNDDDDDDSQASADSEQRRALEELRREQEEADRQLRTVEGVEDERLIQLDHMWVLEGHQEMNIVRYYTPSPLAAPFIGFMSLVGSSTPWQMLVHVAMRTVHSSQGTWNNMAQLFDEDSGSTARLKRWAVAAQRWEDSMLRYSHTIPNLESPSLLDRLRALRDAAKEYRDNVRQTVQARVNAILNNEEEDEYTAWERSDEKKTWPVHWMDSDGETSHFMGNVEIDPEAPVLVLREKLRRTMRDVLNKHKGEAFVIALELTDLREEDGLKYKVQSTVRAVVNNETLETTDQIVLRADGNRKFEEVPLLDENGEELAEMREDDDDEEGSGDNDNSSLEEKFQEQRGAHKGRGAAERAAPGNKPRPARSGRG